MNELKTPPLVKTDSVLLKKLSLLSKNLVKIENGNETIYEMWLDITPNLADFILSYNTNNRPISKGHLSKLVKEMSDGKWRYTSAPITISKNDVLMDGQYRLTAILMSGTSHFMKLTYGLEYDVFTVLDNNKVRTGSDVLGALGVPNSSLAASTVKLLHQISIHRYGEAGSSSRILSNDEIVEKYFADKRLESSVATGKKLYSYCNNLISPSIISAFYHIFTGIDENKGYEFIEKLCTGDNIQSKSPILALRDKLIKVKTNKTFTIHQADLIRYIIMAWKKYLNNEKVSGLRLPESEVKL
jgi:hypothetical protein